MSISKLIKNMSLEELLDTCENRTSPNFESAWTELIHRYKKYIAAIVNSEYKNWTKGRTNVDLSEITNDIISNVFLTLYNRDCEVLKRFKARNNEKVFRGYLATIAKWLSFRTLQKYIKNSIVFSDENNEATSEQDNTFSWQIFDHMVCIIRRNSTKNQKFTERDILIFNLYMLEGFSPKMIETNPLFKDIGGRVVDNAVTRCKNKLNHDDQNTLRELLT